MREYKWNITKHTKERNSKLINKQVNNKRIFRFEFFHATAWKMKSVLFKKPIAKKRHSDMNLLNQKLLYLIQEQAIYFKIN